MANTAQAPKVSVTDDSRGVGSIQWSREAGARYRAEVMATDIEMAGMRECNIHMAWVVDILDR